MSTKNNVIKLVGNKLFITLLVFAIAIILISAMFSRNAKQVAHNQEEPSGEMPVISNVEAVNTTIPVEEAEEVIAPVEEEAEVTEEVMAEITYKLPVAGQLQKKFSVDELLWDETMEDWRTHNGIDIAGDIGTVVDTCAPGKVLESYEDEMYGFVVKIQHGDGVVTVYKNLEKTVVKKDDTVDEGQMIGTVGEKGAFEMAQKPHLHFEVIVEGKNINPLEFIK